MHDALTHGIFNATNKILNDLKSRRSSDNPYVKELRMLLAKIRWGIHERIQWEKNLSQLVSDELELVNTLGVYRSVSRGTALQRPVLMNELSKDIVNGTTDIEYDCEAMSVVEGIILQKIENTLLPVYSYANGLKSRLNYYYISGLVSYADETNDDFEGEHHAFILTPTNNVIEGTSSKSNSHYTYKISVNQNTSIRGILSGQPLKTVDWYGEDVDIYWVKSDEEVNPQLIRAKAQNNDMVLALQDANKDEQAYHRLMRHYKDTLTWNKTSTYKNTPKAIEFYHKHFSKISSASTAKKLRPVIVNALRLTDGKIGNPFKGTAFTKVGQRAIREYKKKYQ